MYGTDLNVDGSGVFVNCLLDLLWIVALHKFALNVELLEVNSELVVRPTIQIHCADKVMPGLAHGGDGHELRGMTGGCGNSTNTLFEHSHTVFEYGVGGITHAGVHVPILRPGKLAGAIGCILEVVGTCLIQRNCPRPIDWVWLLSTVEGKGLKLRFSVILVSNLVRKDLGVLPTS